MLQYRLTKFALYNNNCLLYINISILTNTDLKNLAVQTRNIIQEETPRIVRSIILEETPKIVRNIVQEETPRIVKDVLQEEAPRIVKEIVSEELKPVKKDIRGLKYRVSRLNNTVRVAIKILDEDNTKLRNRVEMIEQRINF